MIVDTYDSSMPFKFVYSELEWAVIVAASPLADAAGLDAERRQLESVATAYLNLSHHHRLRSAGGFPTRRWKARRRQIAKDLAEAEQTNVIASVLAELREDLRRADVAVEGFEMLGKEHQGRRDPAQAWLCDAAIAMWQRLGGGMSITRAEYGRAAPSGPVFDFMTAVLTPVLMDNTPGAEALRKFIRRKRKPATRA
jgi:hypothetical protein